MKLKALFKNHYNSDCEVIARAPGRLEILGNHTDYNEGFVLSCAVQQSTYFAAAKTDSSTCRIYSQEMASELTFDIDNIGKAIPGEWLNYIKGICLELQKRGHSLNGFNAVITSDIPLSSGMGSSAALEVAAAYAIGKMNDIELEQLDWAKLCQACENNYIGANTGLLDQLSSIRAVKDHFVLTDFRNFEQENIKLPKDVSLIIANSGVAHDLTKEYNDRRRRCEDAAKCLSDIYGVTALRDINRQQLEESKPKLDILSYRRAKHIIEENDRVIKAKAAIEAQDLITFGRLLTESQESSRINFENSCQELDILTGCGKVLSGFYGARLSGGGFGGISIHLVDSSEAEIYRKRLETAFEIEVGRKPDTMVCKIGQGAEIYV